MFTNLKCLTQNYRGISFAKKWISLLPLPSFRTLPPLPHFTEDLVACSRPFLGVVRSGLCGSWCCVEHIVVLFYGLRIMEEIQLQTGYDNSPRLKLAVL